jgi:hypothetical protein
MHLLGSKILCFIKFETIKPVYLKRFILVIYHVIHYIIARGIIKFCCNIYDIFASKCTLVKMLPDHPFNSKHEKPELKFFGLYLFNNICASNSQTVIFRELLQAIEHCY